MDAGRAVEGSGGTLAFAVGLAVLLIIFWRLLPSGLADVRGKVSARVFTYYRWFAYAGLTFITGFFLVAVVAEVPAHIR